MRAFGGGDRFHGGVVYWISIAVTIAAIAIAVSGTSPHWFRLNTVPMYSALTALGLVWFFVLLNLRGVRRRRLVQIP